MNYLSTKTSFSIQASPTLLEDILDQIRTDITFKAAVDKMKKDGAIAAASLSGGDLMLNRTNEVELNYCKAMRNEDDADFTTIPRKIYDTLMGGSDQDNGVMQVSFLLINPSPPEGTSSLRFVLHCYNF